MDPDRTIGRILKVKSYEALVELSADTGSYVKSTYQGLYSVAAINSFVIIPVGTDRLVGAVTSLDLFEDTANAADTRQTIVLPSARRTMWVSLIGTISQVPGKPHKRFAFGISRYPELENPVWYASYDDLDTIFERECDDEDRRRRLVTIGKSPMFNDYDVRIDMDAFFGKHSAILGNTGSGKSCTIAALIRAVLDAPDGNGMPHAHFIIFDTNAEYEAAFTQEKAADSGGAPHLHFQRLVLTNGGATPEGLWVPHWFMDGRDFTAMFRPGEGAQVPLLHKAIAAARAPQQEKAFKIVVLHSLDDAVNGIEGFLANPPTGNSAYHGLKNLGEMTSALLQVLTNHQPDFDEVGLGDSYAIYHQAAKDMAAACVGGNYITAITSEAMRPQIEKIRARLQHDLQELAFDDVDPIGIDSPIYFDFRDFVERVFRDELARETRQSPNLRNWVGTLLMRLEQAKLDPRYAFLFRTPQFQHSLASFLRLICGVQPSHNFDKPGAAPPWKDNYVAQHPGKPVQHQVTIIDFSQLASDVLENVTALIGRLILEFMQRCPDRGAYPIVLVLEEAHHYIPAHAVLDRQIRAREVFERIAREGRKYGLSLLVASQRPSELSRTVLAQCNSFIVHRIQNPDDRAYFQSVISDMNRELLNQLPALPQQHALIMGDCITVPLQARINDVDPKPRSHDPEFFKRWSDAATMPPDFEAIASKWEGQKLAAPDAGP
jgi:uncharacterized protein